MLKVLSPEAIWRVEQRTLEQRSLRSRALMERAAARCCAWISRNVLRSREITFLCGMGNNGGNGLATARRLWYEGFSVRVVEALHSDKTTPDRQAALAQLRATPSRLWLWSQVWWWIVYSVWVSPEQ